MCMWTTWKDWRSHSEKTHREVRQRPWGWREGNVGEVSEVKPARLGDGLSVREGRERWSGWLLLFHRVSQCGHIARRQGTLKKDRD